MTADRRPAPAAHAAAVAAELEWLSRTIDARLRHFLTGESAPFVPPPPPDHVPDTALGALIADGPLDPAARLTLALALAPHIQPALLDPFFLRNTATDRIFTEVGGHRGETGGFRPTLDTALFLVAGTDTAARIAAMACARPDHPLRARTGLSVAPGPDQAGALTLPLHRVLSLSEGAAPLPDHAADFPARRLTTRLDWDDLVLPQATLHRVGDIVAWTLHERRLLSDWGLERSLGRGFRALFYGPPGTGKSLTAGLLGKRTGLPVYRIDLSMVVSKYIGETEKNLAGVFDRAEESGWILFFDEADALFGARSDGGGTANDRHANQEVAYLLQRIEDCSGVVILATNLRGNIDEAFFRRFQTAIHFPRPDAQGREKLLRGVFGDRVPLATDVDLTRIARDHDLSGGSINNVARHAAVTALRRGADAIAAADLQAAIAFEMQKEGRTP